MIILSLFDGISIAQQALKNLGAKVDLYFSSEIDKYAIQIAQKNFPDTIQLGDIKGIEFDKQHVKKYPVGITLLIGGSPCQDLSIAKKGREGLSGSRSGLFYEYLRILKEVRPKYFVLENVASMPIEARTTITMELFNIPPVMINAALVSAQNRKRLFWVGKLVGNNYEQVVIPQPEDRGILLRDVLEDADTDKLKAYCIDANYFKGTSYKHYKEKSKRQLVFTKRIGQIGKGGQADRIYSPDGKSVNLSANGGGRGAKTGLYAVALTETRTDEAKKIRREYRQKTGRDFSPRREKELKPRGDEKANTITTGQTKESLILENSIIRKLTPIECERLQSLPDNYTEGISNTQRYKALGNGFNCAVIEHILKNIL